MGCELMDLDNLDQIIERLEALHKTTIEELMAAKVKLISSKITRWPSQDYMYHARQKWLSGFEKGNGVKLTEDQRAIMARMEFDACESVLFEYFNGIPE